MIEDDDFAAAVGRLAVLLVFLPLHAVWHAWVLLKLWTWFVVPFGAPVLRLSDAAGISLVASYLTHQYVADTRKTSEKIFYGFTTPLIVLLFGTVFALWAGR